MSHAPQKVPASSSQAPNQGSQSAPVQQQAQPSQMSARSALYANGGARERARLADPDLINGRPRSRSKWYGR